MGQRPVRVLALRHITIEHLGLFERLFTDAGAHITYVDLALGGKLPAAHDGYDLLVILGGPMSVNDEDKCAWLVGEKRFVRQAVERGKTTLGLCLGAQMISSSFGASVAPGRRHEIGFMEIEVAEAAASDPLLGHFARPRQTVFQLHGEGFELARGAVALASSPLYPNQAFRLGPRCWGLQFHVETDLPMLEDWVREYWGEPAALAPESPGRAILSQAGGRLPDLGRLARAVADELIKTAGGEGGQ